MIKIYHNNSCSKSRIALVELTKSGEEFEVINYLEQTPSVSELTEIVNKLGVKPHDLIRVTEKLYKEKYKDQNLSYEEWIEVMHKNPILIQRPIIVSGDIAVIARSKEELDKVI